VHAAALREMLLALLADPAAAAGSEFFGAVEHVRLGLDSALLRRTVSVTMLDQWEESTAGYGARYMTVPPLRLLCDILLDLGDVHRMCAQRQPIDSAERLCRLAAQLAGFVGIILLDLGDQRLARAYFRTARTAARGHERGRIDVPAAGGVQRDRQVLCVRELGGECGQPVTCRARPGRPGQQQEVAPPEVRQGRVPHHQVVAPVGLRPALQRPQGQVSPVAKRGDAHPGSIRPGSLPGPGGPC